MIELADDANATHLTLEVRGYEFPEGAEDRWDRNWLVIGGHVVARGSSWRFSQACLTTFELAHLRRWFEALHGHRFPMKRRTFTEPNLEFTYDHVAQVLGVHFRLEVAPPHLLSGPERFEGIGIQLAFTPSEAQLVVTGIEGSLRRFPERSAVV